MLVAELGARRALDDRPRNQLAARTLVEVLRKAKDVGLEDVFDQREAARHVAVQRRVADRELGLVARRNHQPPELVRQRHQQHAADPRLQVLLGQIGLPPLERLGEDARECLDDGLDPDLAEIAVQPFREPARVLTCRLRRVTRGHRHAVHALGPERFGRKRGGDRRIDATRDADHDLAEAVLRNVVAEAELECKPHLLELGLERNRGAREAIAVRPGRTHGAYVHDLNRRRGLPLSGERTPAHVA